MDERCVLKPAAADAERSGERMHTSAEAVASLLESAAGAAAAPAASQGSARTDPEPPPNASSHTLQEIAEASIDDSAAAAEDPEAEAAAPTSITQLPDAILSEILEHLGLQAAAAVRAVCRRWRDAAEAIRWRRLDVKLSSERADQLAGLLIGAQGLDWSQLDAAVRAGVAWWLMAGRSRGEDNCNARVGGRGQRIRVAPGASLRLEVTSATDDAYAFSEAWRSTLFLLTACSAAAGAASGAGAGGLGEVDVDCSWAPSSCLTDLLDALAPPGAAACPSLRRLALRGRESRGRHPQESIPLGVDPDLRPMTFPNLENLYVDVYCCSSRRPAAEALVRCLPNLKRLEFLYGGVHDAIGGIAVAFEFPLLEYLGAIGGSRSFSAPPLIERLASGPTALALKELVLNLIYISELTPKALRALQRFPALERLKGNFLFLDSEEGNGENALAALGALPALKSLGQLALRDSEALAAHLNGFAAAFERSSTLTDLHLYIEEAAPREALPALARLAGAARGRLTLHVSWRVGENALAALGSCPGLTSLGRLVLRFASPELEGLAAHLNGLAAAFERSPTLTDLHLHIGMLPPPEALPALARLAGAARGGLSLELDVLLGPLAPAPGRLEPFAAALAAAPPRRLSLFVSGPVDELDCLSALAGCSTGDIDIELHLTYRPDRDRGGVRVRDAGRAAVLCALPSARVAIVVHEV
eukprot:tig00020629_g12341.t1